MISHFESTLADIEHSLTLPDKVVSRVLDCARFFCRKPNEDGTDTDYWRLIKDVNGHKAGAVLSLERLHAVLFP